MKKFIEVHSYQKKTFLFYFFFFLFVCCQSWQYVYLFSCNPITGIIVDSLSRLCKELVFSRNEMQFVNKPDHVRKVPG